MEDNPVRTAIEILAVTAGLVPAIHALGWHDARDKPGQDEGVDRRER
jgi:hypothetical protein